jgi:hypothetical protein
MQPSNANKQNHRECGRRRKIRRLFLVLSHCSRGGRAPLLSLIESPVFFIWSAPARGRRENAPRIEFPAPGTDFSRDRFLCTFFCLTYDVTITSK